MWFYIFVDIVPHNIEHAVAFDDKTVLRTSGFGILSQADGTDKLSVLRVLGVTQFETQLLCSEIKEIEGSS